MKQQEVFEGGVFVALLLVVVFAIRVWMLRRQFQQQRQRLAQQQEEEAEAEEAAELDLSSEMTMAPTSPCGGLLKSPMTICKMLAQQQQELNQEQQLPMMPNDSRGSV